MGCSGFRAKGLGALGSCWGLRVCGLKGFRFRVWSTQKHSGFSGNKMGVSAANPKP